MAVVIAAIIIAGTMAFIFRYEVEPAGIGVAYRYTRRRLAAHARSLRR
jgi:hypothetical protein